MLTHADDVEAHGLRERGWTISAVARHFGRDRKGPAYLNGERTPGLRVHSAPDPLEPFEKHLVVCAPRRDIPAPAPARNPRW